MARRVIHSSLHDSQTSLFHVRYRAVQQLNRLLYSSELDSFSSSSECLDTRGYPWCFVAPVQRRWSHLTPRYYVGAYLPTVGATQDGFNLLFTPLGDKCLESLCVMPYSLPFWLARVLAPLNHQCVGLLDYIAVRQWCDVLSHASNEQMSGIDPLFEPLCREVCRTDYALDKEDGVTAMPWSQWPGCILPGNHLWLWRQSRHGKIIDARQVAIA